MSRSTDRSVLVVVVSWFGSADVGRLLASLRAGCDDWRLVVVDNSCDVREHDALCEALAGEPRAQLVDAGANLGYLGGARRALATVSAPSAWTVVANTDLEFAPDFVERLSGLRGDSVVAPAIVSGVSGADQNPYLVTRPSRWTVLRWRCQFATVPSARLVVALGHLWSLVRRTSRGPGSGARRAATAPRRIYAPHGSCVALPRAYFERGGSLDHGAFLFGEEITLAENARRIGLPVVHVPQLVVRHAEHRTTGWWRSAQTLGWQRASVRQISRLLEAQA